MVAGQVQESLTLDYKSARGLERMDERAKADLAEDASAFANAAGGQLIFGIEEADHPPQRVDDGVDATRVTREWLEQVIDSGVQRRIENLRIHPVPLKRSAPNQTAYVLDVPQSARAPHMVDHRYFKR